MDWCLLLKRIIAIGHIAGNTGTLETYMKSADARPLRVESRIEYTGSLHNVVTAKNHVLRSELTFRSCCS